MSNFLTKINDSVVTVVIMSLIIFILGGWGVCYVFGLSFFKGLVAFVLASVLTLSAGGSSRSHNAS